MTAEEIKEEASERGLESEFFEQNANARKDSVIEDGEGGLVNSEVDISLTNRVSQFEDRQEDEDEVEEGDGVEDKGAIEQRGNAEPYGSDGEKSDSEEGCPFCLYMKSGACEESFTHWEECINEGEKAGEDVVEKCVRVTRLLKQCMRANADYYGAVLDAENAMAGNIANAADGLDDASKEKADPKESDEMGAQNAAPKSEG